MKVCEGAVMLSLWEKRQNMMQFGAPLPELLTCQ